MKYITCYEIECRRSINAPWEFLVRVDVPYNWQIVTSRILGFVFRRAKPDRRKEAVRRAEIRAAKAAETCWRVSGVEDIRILCCTRNGWKTTKRIIWQNARFLE